jgi:hypothetical protein
MYHDWGKMGKTINRRYHALSVTPGFPIVLAEFLLHNELEASVTETRLARERSQVILPPKIAPKLPESGEVRPGDALRGSRAVRRSMLRVV